MRSNPTKVSMTLPQHPTDERSATWFHAIMGAIGVLHVIGGLVMLAWHGTAAYRHHEDAKHEKDVRKD